MEKFVVNFVKNNKILVVVVLALLFGFITAPKPKKIEVKPDEMYLFYQTTCPHCHDAMAFIAQKMPNLQVMKIDIADPKGLDLMLACAEKMKIEKNTLGTPLICAGEDYILGWSKADERKFLRVARKFEREKEFMKKE